MMRQIIERMSQVTEQIIMEYKPCLTESGCQKLYITRRDGEMILIQDDIWRIIGELHPVELGAVDSVHNIKFYRPDDLKVRIFAESNICGKHVKIDLGYFDVCQIDALTGVNGLLYTK